MDRHNPVPSAGNTKDFDKVRFDTFRQFSIRLAFLVSCFPVAALIADYVDNPHLISHFFMTAIASTLLLLAYPLAGVGGAPKRSLPWILYGSVGLVMALVAHEQLNYGRTMEMLFTGTILIFMTPIIGMPFPWKVNVVCESLLFLVFAIFMYVAFGLTPFTIRVGVISVLMVTAIDFVYRQFEWILRIQHLHLRRIEKMAIKDVLSGQYNRRYFLETGAQALLRCNRYGRPVSLALLDIDHFKTVNDRFGHDVGDVVIRETARCMRRRVRETDLVARWGGEEFVILLPESDRETSRQVAERVRQDIAAMSITVKGLPDPVSITASLGVAEAKPETDTLKTLVKSADQALYRAKTGGRNRVILQNDERLENAGNSR